MWKTRERKAPAEVFKARLVEDEFGCLVFTDKWADQEEPRPYGRFTVQGKHYTPSRFAFEMYHGREPEGVVRHLCRQFGAPKSNPRCCKEEHLAEGTMAENNRDRVLDGTSKWMKRQLTVPQIIAVWEEHKAGVTIAALSKKYNVSDNAIKQVIRGPLRDRLPATRRRGDNFKAGGRPGELSSRAKLTDAQAEEIRTRYAAGGIRHVDLAKEYGVSQLSISNLLKGHTYTDTPRPERGRRFNITGEASVHSKVTWEQVREMRRRYAEGAYQIELAEEFGIKKGTVWQILNHKTWREDPGA